MSVNRTTQTDRSFYGPFSRTTRSVGASTSWTAPAGPHQLDGTMDDIGSTDGLTLTSLQAEAKQGSERPTKRRRCSVPREAVGEASARSALGERKKQRERSRAEKGLPPKPRRARAKRSTVASKTGQPPTAALTAILLAVRSAQQPPLSYALHFSRIH